MPRSTPVKVTPRLRAHPYTSQSPHLAASLAVSCPYPLRSRAKPGGSVPGSGGSPPPAQHLYARPCRSGAAVSEPAASGSFGSGKADAPKLVPLCPYPLRSRTVVAEPATTDVFGNMGVSKLASRKAAGPSSTDRPPAEPAARGQGMKALPEGRGGRSRKDPSGTHKQASEPATPTPTPEDPKSDLEKALPVWSTFALSSTLPMYRAQAENLGLSVESEPTNASVFNLSKSIFLEAEGLQLLKESLKEFAALQPPPHQPSKKRKRSQGGARNRLQREIAEGDGFVEKTISLLVRSYSKGDLHMSSVFSAAKDGSYASTGWHGRPPSTKDRKEIHSLYFSGRIKEVLEREFYPVRYDLENPKPSILIDSQRCAFAYRTTQLMWMEQSSADIHSAIEALLRPHLNDTKLAAKHAKGSRGSHFPCIIGHHQQYTQVPTLTQFHVENAEAVKSFYETPIIQRISRLVSKLVLTIFPGVALRSLKSAVWQAKMHGITPLFGQFWNLCINGMFTGQKRIFTAPHADAKNIVGVCAVVVYVIPGKRFDHKKKAWLVLWEAGLVVELPPWVVFLYPSSLLYHFNIDVDDMKFVITDGDRPTPENSSPLGGDGEEGRGSLVYFNQASMFKGAETGFDTLTQARKAGQTGAVDPVEQAGIAFSKFIGTADVTVPTL